MFGKAKLNWACLTQFQIETILNHFLNEKSFWLISQWFAVIKLHLFDRLSTQKLQLSTTLPLIGYSVLLSCLYASAEAGQALSYDFKNEISHAIVWISPPAKREKCTLLPSYYLFGKTFTLAGRYCTYHAIGVLHTGKWNKGVASWHGGSSSHVQLQPSEVFGKMAHLLWFLSAMLPNFQTEMYSGRR